MRITVILAIVIFTISSICIKDSVDELISESYRELFSLIFPQSARKSFDGDLVSKLNSWLGINLVQRDQGTISTSNSKN